MQHEHQNSNVAGDDRRTKELEREIASLGESVKLLKQELAALKNAGYLTRGDLVDIINQTLKDFD